MLAGLQPLKSYSGKLPIKVHLHKEQNQLWKLRNNMWKMIKVNIKDTETTTMNLFYCLYCYLWSDLTHFLRFALLFEQVTASWVITICWITLLLIMPLDRHSSCSRVLETALSRNSPLWKRCSEKMQQIYRRTPMPKFDFNKVALQFCLNHTLAWVCPFQLVPYFQKTFL